MYIIRFVRKDGEPSEEYLYQRKEDVMYHFSLFEKDDSLLYSCIEVAEISKNCELSLAKMHLSS